MAENLHDPTSFNEKFHDLGNCPNFMTPKSTLPISNNIKMVPYYEGDNEGMN